MSVATEVLRQTPLYKIHKNQGAKFTLFGGWEMPVYYSGIIPEHMSVRQNVGIFDVSHMCPILVEGEESHLMLQYLCTNNIEKLGLRRVQYNLLCNESGGVVDDILLYRLEGTKFIVVANASNAEKVKGWLHSHSRKGVTITDLQPNQGLISLQGPKSVDILRRMGWEGLSGLRKNDVYLAQFMNKEILISRTGYTGSDGYEFLTPNEAMYDLWNAFTHGEGGALPCGLGARDSLRTEAGLPLYGHEYTEDRSPLGTPFAWAMKFDKGDFLGREALIRERETGSFYALVGFSSESRSIPRSGQKIFFSEDLSGAETGWVSSGTFSPILSKSIGFAFIQGGAPKAETPIYIDVRGRAVRAIITALPFIGKK